ncbi:MAG: DNA alkylation repair protein [Thermodesulfobacteriota bacterium]
MEYTEVMTALKELSNPEAVKGMAGFGINPEFAYGVSIPALRNLARKCRKNGLLAENLWDSGIHEARILATMIADWQSLSEEQMESWAGDFNSWDLCDQCCNNLFRKSRFAHQKAVQWTERDEEFVKRAGFVLMACLAVHDKQAPDSTFAEYLGIIEREAHDTRNFVKKAVNWALRQIGKRHAGLHALAVDAAQKIGRSESKAARWVASDALRELTSAAVRARLGV